MIIAVVAQWENKRETEGAVIHFSHSWLACIPLFDKSLVDLNSAISRPFLSRVFHFFFIPEKYLMVRCLEAT